MGREAREPWWSPSGGTDLGCLLVQGLPRSRPSDSVASGFGFDGETSPVKTNSSGSKAVESDKTVILGDTPGAGGGDQEGLIASYSVRTGVCLFGERNGRNEPPRSLVVWKKYLVFCVSCVLLVFLILMKSGVGFKS